MNLNQVVNDFASLAIASGGWMELDRLYLKNRLLLLIGGSSLHTDDPIKANDQNGLSTDAKKELRTHDKTSHLVQAQALIRDMVGYAVANKKIRTDGTEKQLLRAQLLDLLTPPPSVVNAFFAQHYSKEPKQATTYFYQLCCQNGLIEPEPVTHIGVHNTSYGEVRVRLLSTPPRPPLFDVLGSSEAEADHGYPKCPYCFENEGFGDGHQAAHIAVRFIRMNLAGESWGFQYAANPQYQEQFFISSDAHTPLAVGDTSVQRMTQILDVFPHYFVALSSAEPESKPHGAYEGGLEDFPLFQRQVSHYIELPDFPLMNLGHVDWPLPVIRFSSPNAEDISAGIAYVWQRWQERMVVAHEIDLDVEPLIIGRRQQGNYVFDVLLATLSGKNNEQQDKPLSVAQWCGVFDHFVNDDMAAAAPEDGRTGETKFSQELRDQWLADQLERLRGEKSFSQSINVTKTAEFLASLEED